MSCGEFLALCRALDVPRDILAPVDAIQIFKRVQELAGPNPNQPGSMYEHICYEEFETAVGLLASHAYSHDPYAQRYPEQHEKVQGFITTFFRKCCRA